MTGVDEVQMITTSADHVRPHIQTVTTYAADFDEVQRIEIDADDIDEWQFAYTDIDRTIYESQVSISCSKSFLVRQEHTEKNMRKAPLGVAPRFCIISNIREPSLDVTVLGCPWEKPPCWRGRLVKLGR